MVRRIAPTGLLLLALALAAAGCGAILPTTPGTSSRAAATQTRAAELAQLATLTAPTATPNAVATQTRTAELAQLATLTAPTPTPNAVATQTRTAEVAQLATFTAATPTVARAEATGAVTTSVGRVANTEILIALVSDAKRTTAYICDGATSAQWFSGSLTGNSIDLLSDEGTHLTATLAPDRKQASGMLMTPDGRALSFSTVVAPGNDRAGLYSATGTANGQNFVMGVIVLASGEFRGIVEHGESLTPVTNPTFGANSVTATVTGLGTLTAQRVTTP